MPGLESSLHWSCIWIDWKDKGSSRYLLVQKDDLFYMKYLFHANL